MTVTREEMLQRRQECIDYFEASYAEYVAISDKYTAARLKLQRAIEDVTMANDLLETNTY